MFHFFSCCKRKNKFEIVKTDNWQTLPLYKKIRHVCSLLGEEYAPYVDKITAKDIVKSVCGEKIKIPEIIRILDGPGDLKESDMNPDYLIKASHGCKWIIDPKINTDIEANKLTLAGWNRIFVNTKRPDEPIEETQYRFIKPRFFIEKKIDCAYSGKSGKALDVKVNCFYGQPKFILVQKDGKRNYYLLDWTPLMEPQFQYERPDAIDSILKLSAALSKPFEYVRMDFYIGVDGIYFSEYTFTPTAGRQRLTEELELEYSKFW
jgi:hypothetical protein